MADVKWIKITTDIFDDEKILLIESLPESDAIIVVWFKLLCLAGKMNNSGVFLMNDRIAYTDKMLSTIFRMKESTVQLALQTFESFGMIEMIDGVITIPNWGKHQSLEQLEARRKYHREYQRDYREKQKSLVDKDSKPLRKHLRKHLRNDDVNSPDKEEDIDKEKEKNNKATPPVYFEDSELNDAFMDYIAMRKKIKAPMSDRAIQLGINSVKKLAGDDKQKALQIINQSILGSWKGFYELKDDKPKSKTKFDNFESRETDYDALTAQLLMEG